MLRGVAMKQLYEGRVDETAVYVDRGGMEQAYVCVGVWRAVHESSVCVGVKT